MKFLSRPEELILISVWRLGNEAYCVPIRQSISEMSGKEWSFGAIYVPLNRLEKKGFLKSTLGTPTSKRGGRSKRYYTLTKRGMFALSEVQKLNETVWTGVPVIPSEKPSSS